MEIRSAAIGAGATVALAVGVFAAMVAANAGEGEPVEPTVAPVVEVTETPEPTPTTEPTATVEPEPVATVEPEPVTELEPAPEPAPTAEEPTVTPEPTVEEPVAPEPTDSERIIVDTPQGPLDLSDLGPGEGPIEP